MIGRRAAVVLIGLSGLVVLVQLLRTLGSDPSGARRSFDLRDSHRVEGTAEDGAGTRSAASLTVLPWQRYPLGRLDPEWRVVSARHALEDEFGRVVPMRPLFGPREPEIPEEQEAAVEEVPLEAVVVVEPSPPPVRVADFSRVPRLSATLSRDGEGLAVLDGRVRKVGDHIPDRDGSDFVLVGVEPGIVWIEKDGERRRIGVEERRATPRRTKSETLELPPLEEENDGPGT